MVIYRLCSLSDANRAISIFKQFFWLLTRVTLTIRCRPTSQCLFRIYIKHDLFILLRRSRRPKILNQGQCSLHSNICLVYRIQYIFIVQNGNQVKYSFDGIFNVVFSQRLHILNNHIRKQISEHTIELYFFMIYDASIQICSLKSNDSSSTSKQHTKVRFIVLPYLQSHCCSIHSGAIFAKLNYRTSDSTCNILKATNNSRKL